MSGEAASDRLPCRVAISYPIENSQSTKEREMRGAYISKQNRIASYLEDMTLNADLELGDFGTCRRR